MKDSLHITRIPKQSSHVSQNLLHAAQSLWQMAPHAFQKIYSIEEDQQNYYLVLETMEGDSLYTWLEKHGMFSQTWTIAIIYQILQGLCSSHQIGAISQAIHPKKIFLQKNGRVKMSAFSLNLAQGKSGFEIDSFSQESQKQYTIKEEEAYYFWSPELYAGEKLDARADIYSTGALFYYLLTNHYPLGDGEGLSYLNRLLDTEAADIKQHLPDIDENLQTIVMKMLRSNKNKRYQSASEVVVDLDAVLNSKTKKLLRSTTSHKEITLNPQKLVAEITTNHSAPIKLLALARQHPNNLSKVQKHLLRFIQKNSTDPHIDELLFIYSKLAVSDFREASKLQLAVNKIKTLLENSDIPDTDDEIEIFIEQTITQDAHFFNDLSRYDNHAIFSRCDFVLNSLQISKKQDITVDDTANQQRSQEQQQSMNNIIHHYEQLQEQDPSVDDIPRQDEQLQEQSPVDDTVEEEEVQKSTADISDEEVQTQRQELSENTSDTQLQEETPVLEYSADKDENERPAVNLWQQQYKGGPYLGGIEDKPQKDKTQKYKPQKMQKIGRILMSLGFITSQQLEEAIAHQQQHGIKIGEALIKLGYISEVGLYQALARQFAVPFVDVSQGNIPLEVIECVPRQIVEERRVLPVKKTARSIIVAMVDPLDIALVEDLMFLLACDVDVAITTPHAMEAAIDKYYNIKRDDHLEEFYEQVTAADLEYGFALDEDEIDDSPPEKEPEPKPERKVYDLDKAPQPKYDAQVYRKRDAIEEVAEEKRAKQKPKTKTKIAKKKEIATREPVPEIVEEPGSFIIEEQEKDTEKPKQRHRILVNPQELGLTARIKTAILQQDMGITKYVKKVSRNWEKFLSDDAGIPGPIERLVAHSRLLLKTMHVTLGTYFVLFANAVDMFIDTVSSYVQGIFRAWKTAQTMKRAIRRRDPNILLGELWKDYTTARCLLYRLTYNSNTVTKQLAQLDNVYQRDITLKLVLELRNHLDQMRRDLDFITEKEISQTAKNSLKDALLSFIPNPLSVFTPLKDFFLLAFAMNYSRRDINNLYALLLHNYDQLIQKLRRKHSIITEHNYQLLYQEQGVYQRQAITEENIDAVISHSRETLRRIIWALCKAEVFFNSQKWNLHDLTAEIKRRHEDCDPLLVLDWEIRLIKCVAQIIKKHDIKLNDNKRLQMLEKAARHRSFYLQKKLTRMFM